MTPDSVSPTPTPKPKRAYTARGDIDKSLLDDIQTGRVVLAAANNGDYNADILTRVKPAVLTRLDGNLKTAADDPDTNLSKDVINTKKAAGVATQEEADGYDTLMTALRVIQKAAGTTYKKDAARRTAYLIGQKNFGTNRGTLEADASAIINLAKTDTLDNLVPADLTAAQAALDAWKQANQAQNDAQDAYSHAVQALRDVVALINDDRRTIQAGADVLYSYKDAANAPTRRAFQLPASRPMPV
jgi:hypothetical protein